MIPQFQIKIDQKTNIKHIVKQCFLKSREHDLYLTYGTAIYTTSFPFFVGHNNENTTIMGKFVKEYLKWNKKFKSRVKIVGNFIQKIFHIEGKVSVTHNSFFLTTEKEFHLSNSNDGAIPRLIILSIWAVSTILIISDTLKKKKRF